MSKTELVFILDRSGSMAGREKDTVGGMNSVLDEHRKADGETNVSIVLFDDRCEVLYDRTPIERVAPLTTKEYYVRGCTALLDAVGGGIKHIKRVQKAMDKKDRADKVIFVITTDGLENASRIYDYAKVKNLIEKRQGKGWEFLFLGANIDAAKEAGRIGIAADRAETFINDFTGNCAMYEAVADATISMRQAPDARIGSRWKNKILKDRKKRG